MLGCILLDECKIHSERFFRGGHNTLLPFVLFLSQNQQISKVDRRRVVIGIYLSIMSGVLVALRHEWGPLQKTSLPTLQRSPLRELAALVTREYGIGGLDGLLKKHLDLALNIAHGGITLDENPEELQRDHIFPRSQLKKAGYPHEAVDHYANDLAPNGFDSMLNARGAKIRQRAEQLFGLTESDFNGLFVDEVDSVDLDEREETSGRSRTDPALLARKRRQAIAAFGRLKGMNLA